MKFYVKNIFQKEVLLKVYLKIGEFLTGNKNTGVDKDKDKIIKMQLIILGINKPF